jgi:hypothetical protein
LIIEYSIVNSQFSASGGRGCETRLLVIGISVTAGKEQELECWSGEVLKSQRMYAKKYLTEFLGFCHLVFPLLQHSNTPPLQPSITPSLHHSNTPVLQGTINLLL